jgi:hypothetical protein
MSSERSSLSPRDAAQGGLYGVPDQEVPLLAAQWLAEGYDSTELRELAALSSADRVEARRGLPAALASIGFAVIERDSPWEEVPWRGYWGQILWSVREIDHKLTAYSAAQQVLEVLGDVPDLWEPGGGEALEALIVSWDERPADRPAIEAKLRAHLARLRADLVPALRTS